MTTRDDLLDALIAWFKVGAVAPTATALTDQQVIKARGGPRPSKPYATIELITFDIERGSDDEVPGLGAGPGFLPTQQIRGERSASASIQTFGSEGAGWLAMAALRLRHESILTLLKASGITINTDGGSTNLSALLDTGFEDRFVRQFEIVYMDETAPEAMTEATNTETVVTFEGQLSDFVVTITEP